MSIPVLGQENAGRREIPFPESSLPSKIRGSGNNKGGEEEEDTVMKECVC